MHTLSLLAAATFTLLGVEGNGNVKEESRTVGEFHAVSLSSGIMAIATLGEKGSLKIEADENLLALVETAVQDGILVIRTKESVRPSKPIKATIVATKIDSVQATGGSRLSTMASAVPRFLANASGGSNVTVEGLAADDVAAESAGGAALKLAGRAKKLSAVCSGGAKIQAYELPLESAQADASGGARIEIAVTNEVAGHASGGASIHLKGAPAKVAVKTSGGARVVRGW